MRTFIIVFAVAWLAGFAGYLFWRDPNAIAVMGPGEWGELLSGLFGPPGFVAVVGTLFQQGGDLKRQSAQIEKQLSQMEQQIAAQLSAADATRSLASATFDQSRAAREQADAAATQTQLAVQGLQIERVRNHAIGLALLAVRYANRLVLKPETGAEGIALIGHKDELRDDFELGAEAVLETVRACLKASIETFKTNPPVLPTGPTRLSFGSLLKNLIDRAQVTQAALEAASGVQEIDQLKSDLALRTTQELMLRVVEMLGLVLPGAPAKK